MIRCPSCRVDLDRVSDVEQCACCTTSYCGDDYPSHAAVCHEPGCKCEFCVERAVSAVLADHDGT